MNTFLFGFDNSDFNYITRREFNVVRTMNYCQRKSKIREASEKNRRQIRFTAFQDDVYFVGKHITLMYTRDSNALHAKHSLHLNYIIKCHNEEYL